MHARRTLVHLSLAAGLVVAACSSTVTTTTGAAESQVKKASTKPSTPKPTATPTPKAEVVGASPSASPTDAPTQAPASPHPSPSATTDTTATTPASPTASPSASASPSPSPSPSPTPAGPVYTRLAIAAFPLATTGTTQLSTYPATAGAVLLLPNGDSLDIISAAGTAAHAAYDLKAMLAATSFANLQAVAVAADHAHVYGIATVGGARSLVTLAIDPGTLDATATATPLQGETLGNVGGLALMASGTLLAADTSNHRLAAIALSNATAVHYAGTSGTAGTVDHGNPSEILFNAPTTVIRADTKVYVLDSGNHRVLALDLPTSAFTRLLGTTAGAADGPFATAQLHGAQGMFLDVSKLYLADTGNNALRLADLLTGQLSTLTIKDTPANALPGGRGVGVLGGKLYASDNLTHLFSFSAAP